jgi:hypothetical protein
MLLVVPHLHALTDKHKHPFMGAGRGKVTKLASRTVLEKPACSSGIDVTRLRSLAYDAV